MEDREFLDFLYQHWSKTTGAQDRYWMPVENIEDTAHLGRQVFDIVAVDESEEKKQIASYLSDEDADFITAVHGCLPDLIRRLHSALDEADRLDEERDQQERRIFNLELQVDDLMGKLEKA